MCGKNHLIWKNRNKETWQRMESLSYVETSGNDKGTGKKKASGNDKGTGQTCTFVCPCTSGNNKGTGNDKGTGQTTASGNDKGTGMHRTAANFTGKPHFEKFIGLLNMLLWASSILTVQHCGECTVLLCSSTCNTKFSLVLCNCRMSPRLLGLVCGILPPKVNYFLKMAVSCCFCLL